MPDRDEERSKAETASVVAARSRRDDAMDEEEKILAGRTDVNMPALLTKDVQGG